MSSGIDKRPIIMVNDAYAKFNISGKMTINNLRFSGIN